MTPETRRAVQRITRPMQILIFTYADAQNIVKRLNAIGARKFDVTITQQNPIKVYKKDLEEFTKLNPDALVEILENPDGYVEEAEKRGPGRPKKVVE